MKFLVIFFVFFIPFNVQAKLIISGYFDDKPIYYEDTSIVSYGNIVYGQIKTNNVDELNQTTNRVTDYLYFCKFDELMSVNNKFTTSDSDGKFISSNVNDSSRRVSPINMDSSENLDTLFGYLGFRNKLKSKCSKVSKKPPRYEIPVVRSEVSVYHVLLDTVVTEGKLKKAWIKIREISNQTVMDDKGNPLIIDNEQFKEYKIVENVKYEMLEYSIDCKNNNLLVTKLIEYDSIGKVTNSFNFPYDKERDGSVVPNSTGESIHKFICTF